MFIDFPRPPKCPENVGERPEIPNIPRSSFWIQDPRSNIHWSIQGNVPQNLHSPVTVVFATPRDSRPGGKGGKDGKDGKGGGMKGRLADSIDFSHCFLAESWLSHVVFSVNV